MDGTECPKTLDRCRVFDALFRYGALTLTDLSEKVKFRSDKLRRLLDHEWFVQDGEW